MESGFDLGIIEKNPSDLYSKPMKLDPRSLHPPQQSLHPPQMIPRAKARAPGPPPNVQADRISKDSSVISDRSSINEAETIPRKDRLRVPEPSIYSEPQERPPSDFGRKQIETYEQSARRKRLAIGFGIAGGVILVGIIVGITGWQVTLAVAPPPTTIVPEVSTGAVYTPSLLQRIDCFPEAEGGIDTADREVCEARGCTWRPSAFDEIPPCFVPQSGADFGFKVIESEVTEFGQRWFLERLSLNGIYGTNFQFVTFEIEMRDENTLRFTFDQTVDSSRYRVPINMNLGDIRPRNPKYEVEVYSSEDSPFAFRITRKSSGTVLWDSGLNGLVFTDQFIQIATLLPSDNIYGLGENLHRSFRHDLSWRSYPMFTRDQPPHSGENKDFNLYSVHPFYECLEEDGQAHGVFLLNSNAIDYIVTPMPMIAFKTIGGILDFYMFLGPSPENVVQQYTAAVGRPYLPPYWSLGFQIARYGYENVSEMASAVDRTVDSGIPLDVQYADIDVMEERRSFTLAYRQFGDLPQHFEDIRKQGIKTIVIVDPPLEINDTYEPYARGLDADGFVKWPNYGSMPEGDWEEYNSTNMMGYAWPPWKVVFPDFFNAGMVDAWGEQIVKLQNLIPFDGLWLDMNEPANFGTNLDKAWNWPEDVTPYWTLKCPESQWDDPPYRTKASFMYDDTGTTARRERLSGKTLCMVAVHAGGYRHYDVHNLYGHKQTEATLPALRQAVGGDKRSIIITRSTFAGDGALAGRWLGDNSATWDDMKLSIIGMLESNLFGIPYIGADICGFFGTPTPQLCMRWHELGAFYPYSRNHNHNEPPHQDPGAFGDGVIGPTRSAMNIRYTLLPYLYTLFHNAHIRGSTVVRPLHHEFSRDPQVWGIDEQFLWGSALLISPILVEVADQEEPEEFTFYVPRGRWYDYYTRTVASVLGQETKELKVDNTVPIQVHIRGGYILPTQEPANNTRFSREKPFGLLVALDEVDGFADGELYWDDGDSIDPYETGNYYKTYLRCNGAGKALTMRIQHNTGVPEMSDLILDHVEIMGVSSAGAIYVNDYQHDTFTYDGAKELLFITGLNRTMTEDIEIRWQPKREPTEIESLRVNCCPEGCQSFECSAKGCLWNPVADVDGVPSCFINPATFGYFVSTIGVNEYKLELLGSSTIMGGDLPEISISTAATGNYFRIKIFDPNQARYEVPLTTRTSGRDGSFEYEFLTNPFRLRLGRSGTSSEILDTYDTSGLVVSDKYLQLSARLASKYCYGIGEHQKNTFRQYFDGKAYPMFNRDQPPEEGANLYSTHPFFMCVEDNGRAHGVLFKNSNAQELILHSGTPAVTYRTTGGVLDIYVIIGNNPEQLIQRYHVLIGRPMIPPYWSLGFHLSRVGYTHMDEMRAAITRNKEAGIPLDSIFFDIDLFNQRRGFTWNRDNYSDWPLFYEELRNYSMKTVMLMHPAVITNQTDYRPYRDGVPQEAFIKFPEGENPDRNIYGNDNLLGWTWPPGRVAFFDYFRTAAKNFWKELIAEFNTRIAFDGIWLDMGEPSNFGTNQDRAFNWPEEDVPYWTLKCPTTEWDDPPYRPRSIQGGRLSDKTICMQAMHNVSRTVAYRHYDVHNLYGHWQTIPTQEALQEIHNKRGLVMTRSTYVSTGTRAGHWLGDNDSIWKSLKQSVIGMMDFNLFGIPLVGANICGYFGDASPELCQRWHQLGAFYPFARNHNHEDAVDQDPVASGKIVADSARDVMRLRYSLLPYLYTLFFQVHGSGGTVVRPLFHTFWSTRETLDIDEQFMWGPALLVSPVLREDKNEIYGYIPTGVWYDFHTGRREPLTGRTVIMDAPADHIPLHVRGGYILPLASPGATSATASTGMPHTLLVAMDASNRASGELYWDGGEKIYNLAEDSENYCLVDLSLAARNISYKFEGKFSDDLAGMTMDTIRILGMTSRPSSFTYSPAREDPVSVTFSPDKQELFIDGLAFDMGDDFAVWWT